MIEQVLSLPVVRRHPISCETAGPSPIVESVFQPLIGFFPFKIFYRELCFPVFPLASPPEVVNPHKFPLDSVLV